MPSDNPFDDPILTVLVVILAGVLAAGILVAFGKWYAWRHRVTWTAVSVVSRHDNDELTQDIRPIYGQSRYGTPVAPTMRRLDNSRRIIDGEVVEAFVYDSPLRRTS